MKRKALLIGNTSGLQGVQIDITRFRNFLISDVGGAWHENEIDVIQNETKYTLLKKIDAIRKQSFDYVTVLFSGHGGHDGQLRQTLLQINGNNENIEETNLHRLASRQLNIYDCCRVQRNVVIESYALDSAMAKSASYARKIYEDRIMQATEQQALLYSCSIGQGSWDTPEGGVYVTNLLNAARQFNSGESFKLVGTAHQEASLLTSEYCRKNNLELQTPNSLLQKYLSSQQLVISIKGIKTAICDLCSIL